MLKILPAFAFLNDVLRYILNVDNVGKQPKITKFYLQGGRYSGKSYQVRGIFSVLLCCKLRIISYITRKTLIDCQKDFETLCDDLKLIYGESFFNANFLITQKPNFTIQYGKYNKIIFEALNDERNKLEKGGKLSARTWNGYNYILIFTDEANEINEKLYQQFRDTCRGLGARKIEFFASNPWNRGNWYIDKCIEHLPENVDLLGSKGYQFRLDKDSFYWRGNYRVNHFIKENNPEIIDGLESYKETDYNTWLIVSLGLCGSVSGQIYIQQLTKALPPTAEYAYVNNFNYMGVDYGFSRSKTCAIFGSMSMENGVDILDEWIHLNEEEKGVRKLSRDEQIDVIIQFAKKQIVRYRKKILAFVDNGYNDNEFYELWNSRLEKHGLTREWLEFFPAEKPDVNMRIDVVNVSLAYGMLRVNKLLTPNLYQALTYCHREKKITRSEDDNLKRSHEWTDEINAMEYMFSNNWDLFMYSNKKLL